LNPRMTFINGLNASVASDLKHRRY